MVSNELINQILDKADIVSVVSPYVKLEKQGANYMGICPFHNDTNPSMSVNKEKKIFKCFVCQTGGNAVGFLMKFKNIPFIEALKEVGDTVGIKVESGAYDEKYQKLNNIHNINNQAAEFYKFNLTQTTNGEEAIKYLHNRFLDDDVINHFQIGLSPTDDLLYKSFKDKYLPIDLVQAGLIKEGANGFYDIFRERIMFPITNLQGKIVAFSGRIFNKEKSPSNPKYLNTLDTIAFKKSELLYNYYESMNVIKQKDFVYLFEGYMDVIASYRCGILNSVASMGTNLTPGQIKAIGKLTKNVVVCYDGDNPGIHATKRATIMFAQNGFTVKVVSFEDNLDPDEYINKYGKEALFKKLSSPISSVDFIYDVEKRNLFVEDANSVESFKNNVFDFISQLKSNTLNEITFNKMANDLHVSVEAIKADYSKIADRIEYNNYNSYVTQNNHAHQASDVINNIDSYDIPEDNYSNIEETYSNVIPATVDMKRYYKAEEGLIKLAYNDRDTCMKIDSILGGKYAKKENGDLINAMSLYYRNNDVMNREALKDLINDPQLMDALIRILESIYSPSVATLDELISIVQTSYDYKYLNKVYSEKRPITIKELENVSKIKQNTIKKRKNKK